MGDERSERLEGLLEALRASVEEVLGVARTGHLPRVLTVLRAARELSVSQRKLRQMIASRDVLTVEIGRRKMIPASEVLRLASPKSPEQKRARGKAMRRHAALSPADEAAKLRRR